MKTLQERIRPSADLRNHYNEISKQCREDKEEVVLDGGCHAYFGMYGAQEGDGAPVISNEEQIRVTVDAIMQFVE